MLFIYARPQGFSSIIGIKFNWKSQSALENLNFLIGIKLALRDIKSQNILIGIKLGNFNWKSQSALENLNFLIGIKLALRDIKSQNILIGIKLALRDIKF